MWIYIYEGRRLASQEFGAGNRSIRSRKKKNSSQTISSHKMRAHTCTYIYIKKIIQSKKLMFNFFFIFFWLAPELHSKRRRRWRKAFFFLYFTDGGYAHVRYISSPERIEETTRTHTHTHTHKKKKQMGITNNKNRNICDKHPTTARRKKIKGNGFIFVFFFFWLTDGSAYYRLFSGQNRSSLSAVLDVHIFFLFRLFNWNFRLQTCVLMCWTNPEDITQQ